MADAPEVPGGKEQKSSPLVKNLILYGTALLVPAILGASTFLFLIKPRLEGAVTIEEPMMETPSDALPMDVQEVTFDQETTSTVVDDPDLAPPILMYQIALSVKNTETKTLIEAKKAYFQARITRLHGNRTEKELKDPFVQDTILRQIKQESNTLLKRLAPESEVDLEVLEAMYLKFSVMAL
ncbi:MAG: hypothetical protein HYV27_03370 [Candidatus Hydrogenedentes bacterium]|nr:hypothetical protein [Candidatus Hydrogenedentota bacterium]